MPRRRLSLCVAILPLNFRAAHLLPELKAMTGLQRQNPISLIRFWCISIEQVNTVRVVSQSQRIALSLCHSISTISSLAAHLLVELRTKN